MNFRIVIAACAVLLCANASRAAGFDGAAAMLCAATSAVTCESQGDCVRGPVDTVNLPLFWRFDPAAKTIASARPGGEPRVSSISIVGGNDTHLVLQGSDAGLGWSASINKQTGKMIVGGGRDEGYLVFGACIAL